jgi:hypothetical protein
MKWDIPLARIAHAAGGHLTRQLLDEAVELLALAAASARIAPKALTSMPSAAVTAVEDHMRTGVPRALRRSSETVEPRQASLPESNSVVPSVIGRRDR